MLVKFILLPGHIPVLLGTVAIQETALQSHTLTTTCLWLHKTAIPVWSLVLCKLNIVT